MATGILAGPSVIVSDLNIERIAVEKAKADTPLVIDPDRMLSCSVVFQSFQPIRRWQPQILKPRCGMQLTKPHRGPLADIRRQSPTFASLEQSRGFGIGE